MDGIQTALIEIEMIVDVPIIVVLKAIRVIEEEC
jgi:hypothetical protein